MVTNQVSCTIHEQSVTIKAHVNLCIKTWRIHYSNKQSQTHVININKMAVIGYIYHTYLDWWQFPQVNLNPWWGRGKANVLLPKFFPWLRVSFTSVIHSSKTVNSSWHMVLKDWWEWLSGRHRNTFTCIA